MAERFICIHGHFYQPPRENPWLESIELQDSAYPYHDWNERITAECYAPNYASRILDGEGRIVDIINNYSKISFNFGPTLLSWIEAKAPDVYEGILQADRESRNIFSGHGSAMAQAYNHMIMPLANQRDKYTQVLWGIEDFQSRYDRKPEGMWLPETAVDLESVEIMAGFGIKYILLEPHQAKRVRKIGTGTWRDVSKGEIDPSMVYLLNLPSGKKIHVFFYDGPISRAVAFEGLLSKGETFANRLVGAFSQERTWPQLVHIATDGETYGHHHRYGEMGLSYALHYIENNKLARLTNYGEFLEKHPPTHEVEINENTSWSCAHGVERWRNDCGCNSGMHRGWNQSWRAPLRQALDWLRDTLAPLYEVKGKEFLKDPWEARNDYIHVVLDRSPETLDRFFVRNASRELDKNERITVLKLLELQRNAMLMYTSCGWFFDELSGIETVQVIQYAGRALQLAQQVLGKDLESTFLDLLEKAKSNISDVQDGRRAYQKFVKPAMVDLQKVGAHYMVSSLFDGYGEQDAVYCYTVDREDYGVIPSGKARVVFGRSEITSEITQESGSFMFCVLHLGDHNIIGGVRRFESEESYQALVHAVKDTFSRSDLPEFIRLLDKHFVEGTYSLKVLFRDEQRKILGVVLDSTLAEAESVYRELYEHHATLMNFISDLGMPMPKGLAMAAEYALNTSLRRSMEAHELDLEKIASLLEEAQRANVKLDKAGLGFALKQTIERLSDWLKEHPDDIEFVQMFHDVVNLARSMPFDISFWKAQNVYFEVKDKTFPAFHEKSEQGDEDARTWVSLFQALGEKLRVRVSA